MDATVSVGTARWIAAGWAALCGAAYTVLSLVRFKTLEPTSYDNAIFEQAIRAYAHLQAPIVPIKGRASTCSATTSRRSSRWSPPSTGSSRRHRRCWSSKRC